MKELRSELADIANGVRSQAPGRKTTISFIKDDGVAIHIEGTLPELLTGVGLIVREISKKSPFSIAEIFDFMKPTVIYADDMAKTLSEVRRIIRGGNK